MEPNPLTVRGRLAYIPPTMLKAILTDTHFWIPVAVLILGTVLLVSLR